MANSTNLSFFKPLEYDLRHDSPFTQRVSKNLWRNFFETTIRRDGDLLNNFSYIELTDSEGVELILGSFHTESDTGFYFVTYKGSSLSVSDWYDLQVTVDGKPAYPDQEYTDSTGSYRFSFYKVFDFDTSNSKNKGKKITVGFQFDNQKHSEVLTFYNFIDISLVRPYGHLNYVFPEALYCNKDNTINISNVVGSFTINSILGPNLEAPIFSVSPARTIQGELNRETGDCVFSVPADWEEMIPIAAQQGYYDYFRLSATFNVTTNYYSTRDLVQYVDWYEGSETAYQSKVEKDSYIENDIFLTDYGFSSEDPSPNFHHLVYNSDETNKKESVVLDTRYNPVPGVVVVADMTLKPSAVGDFIIVKNGVLERIFLLGKSEYLTIPKTPLQIFTADGHEDIKKTVTSTLIFNDDVYSTSFDLTQTVVESPSHLFVLDTSVPIIIEYYLVDPKGRRSDQTTVKVETEKGVDITDAWINMVYTMPTIRFDRCFRSDSKGIADDSGTYISEKVVCTFTDFASVKSPYNKGLYPLQCSQTETKLSDGTYKQRSINMTDIKTSPFIYEQVLSTFDAESGYDITFVFKDAVYQKVIATAKIPAAFVLLNFKAGGKGMSIGEKSLEDKKFTVALDTDFKGNVHIAGDLVVDGSGGGSSGGGLQILEHYTGTNGVVTIFQIAENWYCFILYATKLPSAGSALTYNSPWLATNYNFDEGVTTLDYWSVGVDQIGSGIKNYMFSSLSEIGIRISADFGTNSASQLSAFGIFHRELF